MASWRINVVRLPLNQDCWLGLQGSPAGSGRTAAGYRAAVHDWVSILHSAGIAVILDLHSSAPAGYSAHGQRAMADAQSVTFWSSLATSFATDPSVIFDLFNEPYSRSPFTLTWSCWKSGGCQAPVEDDYSPIGPAHATYAVAGMDALVAAVRAAGAPQPVMLGGLNYSNDLTGWLASRPTDDQLVASWHNYPGQGCSSATCWNAQILPVAAVVPVVTGEFGQNSSATDAGYMEPFMNWADANGIGYLPWAWWDVPASESVSNSIYALINGDFSPKVPNGTAFHDHLAAVSGPQTDRVSGTDRYRTAVAMSQVAYPSGAHVVYVATGENYPDALSAGPAAAIQHGPLLLTQGGSLPLPVRTEIARLSPDTIVVVGGEPSVSAGVYADLIKLAPTVVRVAGKDRYETSRKVAAYAFSSSAGSAWVATGVNFPDALSGGAPAGAAGVPMILVDGRKTAVDVATLGSITAVGATSLHIAGGYPSVSHAIETQLASLTPTTRHAGADRFATSAQIVEDTYTAADHVFLASGMNFPDALAGSAWAAALHEPLFIVPPTCVPQRVLDDITALGATRVTILGGAASLSASVMSLAPC
jgi:putative cell wall-binding protein